VDDELLHVDTHGSSFDTVLAVYTGTAVNALGPAVAENDDAGPGTNSSMIAFAFDAGTRYHIAVDGKTANDVGEILVHYYIVPEGMIPAALVGWLVAALRRRQAPGRQT
jgi:hypothetical protein